MTQHQEDPDAARDRLLARLQKLPVHNQWGTAAMAHRIAKMSDRQVCAALAMSDEEIAADPDRTPEYAPPTGDKPVILWHHADGG